MRLSGMAINDDDSATGVLTEESAGVREDTLVHIPASTFATWLDSSGDGATSYRSDLLTLVIAHKE